MEAIEDQRFKSAVSGGLQDCFYAGRKSPCVMVVGSLNVKFLFRLSCLNTCTTVGGTVWESYGTLGGAALLGKVRHWGCSLRLYSSSHFLFILCFLTADAMCPIIFSSYHHVFLAKISGVPSYGEPREPISCLVSAATEVASTLVPSLKEQPYLKHGRRQSSLI